MMRWPIILALGLFGLSDNPGLAAAPAAEQAAVAKQQAERLAKLPAVTPRTVGKTDASGRKQRGNASVLRVEIQPPENGGRQTAGYQCQHGRQQEFAAWLSCEGHQFGERPDHHRRNTGPWAVCAKPRHGRNAACGGETRNQGTGRGTGRDQADHRSQGWTGA